MAQPILFLDRDGIINVDSGYVHRREDFVFVDGIFDLVACANLAGYQVVIVTNQAGIGRGYYTETDFWILMNWVTSEFASRGGRIDKIYFCPDHPEHGVGEYHRDSEFRKPGPGMLLLAAEELDADLSRSILLGDKKTDVDAGLAAGVGTLLYFGAEEDCGPAMRLESLHGALPLLGKPAG